MTTTPLPSADNPIASASRKDSAETIKVFSETASKENPGHDRQRLCAHTLFSSFTAGIIQKNTLFTR